ncbi:BatD family protein [Legionella hackeliae]|uniref:DUF7939 domain-containing protein n=1 Tax=Legionella hackeliae TaxID=449 RepID=A0A0A8UX47_LEGHA|nr:BatD family protein [Legionella hackeliae]KTD12674.1 KQDN repeat-containing protein [Legionella hackeliae]CEK12091.1 conserved exported protein of unknown function [Legionella hackeliae]STX48879.1 KQDN repeat-containing protein [Legionella hackeliae]
MKKILLSLILLCITKLGFATAIMQLESSKVQAGDTVRLILTLDGAESESVPDLTPLQKNFSIVGTERSMNYTVINGQAQSTGQWLILLVPKKTGVLTIPSIQVGQEKTAPTTLEVTEEALETQQTDSTQPVDVKLIGEVSEVNPYVNQQVIYTVKLYNSRRLINVEYQPPQVEDGLLIPLGSGRRYQTAENGRLYGIDEQQYAIFPQKSGPIKITPPTFSAVIYDAVPKHIKERAKAITLNVRPVPTQYVGKTWLPAKQVNLTENYDNNTLSFQQGSTLVRTVTLEATAVPAQLLPALDFGNSPDFSIYPEKPLERNSFKQSNIVGTTTVKVTYLLNKAGQITIPTLQLVWFNTSTGMEEVTTLPARTLEVIAAPNVQASPKTPQTITTTTQQQPAPLSSLTMKQEKKNEIAPPMAKSSTQMAWWIALVFALAWLLTLVLWFWQRRANRDSSYDMKHILKRLEEACLHNDASSARDALMRWAHKQWPESNLLNLSDVENKVDDLALKEQIKELAQALYYKSSKSVWQGDLLWGAIISFKRSKNAMSKDNSLPPLHKL